MPLPKITTDTIQHAATDKSFSRGESYFQAGAVREVTLRQNALYASVEGNELEPYQVSVSFDKNGITQAHCNCLYSFGGWCKHIVATLLVCVHEPETIEERPSLEKLLAPLDLAQTKSLIQSLVEETPRLIESVDFHATTLALAKESSVSNSKASKNKFERKTSVNPAPYKQRVRETIRNTVYEWEQGGEGYDFGEDINSIIDDAMTFAENGDGHSARVLLKAVTDGCIQYWDMVDDMLGDMPPAEFGIEFDTAWTEAILCTELTEDEQLYWQQEIESWQDVLDVFPMSLEALRQGWDYPPLQAVFDGNITSKGAWENEAPDWADQFSQIRLKILAQQERYDDYLLLAEAEGQTQAYLTMLTQLGREEEAIALTDELTTLEDAIALAKTLHDQGHSADALPVAMQGLHFETNNPSAAFDFAIWTRNLAEDLKDSAIALEAALIAFNLKPSLQDYQIIEKLSGQVPRQITGQNWNETKEQLLQQLRERSTWQELNAQVEIFLLENLLDDAIAKLSALGMHTNYYDQLVLSVMDTAIPSPVSSHVQWVIESATARAQSIITQGKARYYDMAIEWLKRLKAAYLADNQAQEWLSYRQTLQRTHERKRKLMKLMQQNQL